MRSLGRLERLALGVMVACTLFVAWFHARWHEPWRDEVQPVLIGRALDADAWHVLRLEGVPPVYFVLVSVLGRFVSPPYDLAIAGAIGYAVLLTGTYRFLRVLSDNPRGSLLVTMALGTTGPFVYELGVIARQYGLGLGLCFWGAALLARNLKDGARRDAWWGATLLALAALTSAHAACFAGGALFSYAVFVLLAQRRVRALLPLTPAAAALALTTLVVRAYPLRSPETNPKDKPVGEVVSAAHELFINCLTNPGWWSPGVRRRLEATLAALFVAGMALAIAQALVRPKTPRPLVGFSLLAGLTASLPLLYIFVFRYRGGHRHHWFYVMPPVLITLGLSLVRDPTAVRWRRWLRALPLGLALPLLGYQLWVSQKDLRADYAGALSSTKNVAERLPQGASVAADIDYTSIGLTYFRPDIAFYSASGGERRLRHLLADEGWHQPGDLTRLSRAVCRTAPEGGVFATATTALPAGLASCASSFAREGEAMLETERFSVWRVDCACLAQDRTAHGGRSSDR